MSKHIDVSLIIPALNEEAVITATLEKLEAYLRKAKGELGVCEVVVVAVGHDRTAELARKFMGKFDAMQVVAIPEKVGKGRDVRAGMQAAQGDYKIFMDADLATPLHHVAPLVQKLRDGADVAIGVRLLDKIHKGKMRSLLSQSSNLLIRAVLLPGLRDTQCGFKGFTADAAEKLFGRLTVMKWGFDMEILRYAYEERMKIAQLTVPDWHETREDDLRGERLGSAAMTALKDLWHLRLQAWERFFTTHWKTFVGLAALVTAGLAYWLAGQQSVWFDEAYSITLAQQTYGELIHSTAIDVHPPLYYMLLKTWSEIFGYSEIALRGFSIACAAVATGFGLALIRRALGIRAMAIAIPIVALSPFIIRYGFEIRMYALAALICVAATHFLIRAVQEKNRLWWTVYALLVAAGMYTMYLAALVFIAHAVWLLYLYLAKRPRGNFFKQPWVLAFTGAVILYIPWLPTFWTQFQNPATNGIATRVGWEQLTSIFSFTFLYLPNWDLKAWDYALVAAIVIGMTYLVIRALQKAGNLRPYLVLLLLFFVVPIILMAILSAPPFRPLFHMRYTTQFILSGSLLLAASLFITFRHKISYAIAGSALVAGVMVYGLTNLHQQGNFVYEMLTRPHAKQVVQTIRTCNDGDMLLTGSALIYFEFKYYLPECDIHFYSHHEIGEKGGYATIYQSPKQYYEGQPINAQTVYFVYTDDAPIELPENFIRATSKSFEKYHVDTYARVE